MIARGIRHHQNWRIGPSLFRRKKTMVGTLNSTKDIVEIWIHICDYRSIYPQLVEFELVRTIGVYQCVWRNKLFGDIWGTLREVIISVIDNDWIWIWTLNSSYISGWIDTMIPFSYISSSGNDTGVIFVAIHCVFDVLRVPEGEFNRLRSKLDHCYQLHQTYQTIILCY